VKYWVAFQTVQILHEYGLNPVFNDKLEEWSSDLYHIVQLMSRNQQRKVDTQHADSCIKILFGGNKTEHWGSLLRVEFGTQFAFRKMNNFALSLAIMSWHRMVQDFSRAVLATPSLTWGIIVRCKKVRKMRRMVISCTWKNHQ
jgi:hypothetical protein